MRVVDLDRDMSDVIPTGQTPDSVFLFDRMTQVSLDLVMKASGGRVLDVASGVGQDTLALAERGARAVGAEPSRRMSGMARLYAEGQGVAAPAWVRAWSDALPFSDGSFDAAICKGALDHFDRPERAVSEMARVVRVGGRVVLAIANFESLACRLGRARDVMGERFGRQLPKRGRRGYDAPSDHLTRYELDLMREQASRHLHLEVCQGVSLGWGMPGWSAVSARLPESVANVLLHLFDGIAARLPDLADVVILAGRPRRTRA